MEHPLRKIVEGPAARFAVRSAAVAYLVWTGTSAGLVAYLLAATAAWVSSWPQGFTTPVQVALLELPAGACLLFLLALAGAATLVAVLLGAATLHAPDRGVPRWLGPASVCLVALDITGVVWAFTQADAVLCMAFALSTGATAILRRVVLDNRAPADEGFGGDHDMESCPEDLGRTVTGYCQLMAVWGSMELVMAMTYLAKVAALPAGGGDFASVMGSGVATGLVLMLEGGYFMACCVVNVRGARRSREARVGTAMLFAGLVGSVSLLAVAAVLGRLGSPDWVEQAFCAVVSCGLFAGSLVRCRQRLEACAVARP